MQRGLTSSRTVGSALGLTGALAKLAEAYGKVEQVEEGLTVLAEALTNAEKSRERFYEAELYRLKGELLLNAERGMQNDERKTKRKGRASSPIHRSAFIVHRSAQADTEACFLKAIEIARKQQAKSLELRATMSLVRLRQYQAKDHAPRITQHDSSAAQHETRVRLDEAHQMLSEVYGWFTEGFDTKDLQEAKTLLEELSHRAVE